MDQPDLFIDAYDNRLVIQVSGGKKDFANWYKQANHTRRQQLANLKPSQSKKQLDAHLDAEMELLGIPSLARNPVNTKKKLYLNR